ncbi:hypothetical protein [Streptomyces sp. SID12501]|uniref:Uncharacterized protein n=1 Tax=Streptomyces sp. SID12501 TaxID=2706042 RepID=A0A6B3C3W5_9ACTN|nr:hypothetical protein [Streptomyces sp. SID12501]NEC91022.1 hypothetical protein [Streptomyces sp. SID12501]
MVRFTHTVPGTRDPGPGLVWAVLVAVLVALLGPSVLGSEHPRVPGGAVAAAEAVPTQGEPYADNADPDDSTAAVRGHRDATGERHAPPVSAPGASHGTATGPLQPARAPLSAVDPPASEQPAIRHGVRAPPSLSGI